MDKLDRNELIDLVNRIRNADGVIEEENNKMIDLFPDNVPDLNAASSIFDMEFEGLLAEEIVDPALAYKPFAL